VAAIYVLYRFNISQQLSVGVAERWRGLLVTHCSRSTLLRSVGPGWHLDGWLSAAG